MLRLTRGDDSLVLAPEYGGAILGWTRRGSHMFRRPSPEAVMLGRPGAVGCFPLVPYCNRIAWRRFSWAGQTHELAANFGDHPHAIHGVGWQRPWDLEAASDDSATLSLHHEPRGPKGLGWPFAFSARFTYMLTPAGLMVRIEATNLHSAPAPMGIGLHPWFPRPHGASIKFQADGVWFNRDALPETHGPVPTEWSHAEGRTADGEPLDNCFTDWHGEAHIPGMRIVAEKLFRNLQIFTRARANFLCVEPMSHVPDAINRAGLPDTQSMTVLAPNETLTGSMTFSPEDPVRA